MAVKKVFQPLIDFLTANDDKKVKSVMTEVMAICSAKAGGGGESASIKDASGKVTHIFCYYHKKWEAVADVEYGAKANSTTGLNSMCKEGTSQWTKQQRAFKKANEELLVKVGKGEVKPGDIAKVQADNTVARDVIVPRADKKGSTEKPTGDVARERRQ